MRKRPLAVIAMLLCVMLCAFGLVACDNGNSDGNESDSTGTQAIAVESVALNKTELTLDIGGEETLTATVTPDQATNKTVVWSSDNPAVATVADGKVTAVAAGTATVTATADGKSATCSVTVNQPAPITEVTAEQWAKIMAETGNFTLTNSIDEYVITGKTDGTTRSIAMGDEEKIVVMEGDQFFSYDNFDGSWKKTSITEEDYLIYADSFSIVALFKDDFASFDYVEGKYVAATLDKTSSIFQGIFQNVEVTFENGALVSLQFTHADGSYVNVNNVGTTTITVPTDYIEDDPTPTTDVTAEQWAKIMAGTDNFSMRMQSGEHVMTYLFDGTTRAQTDDEYMQIFMKEGDEYYSFDNFNGSWVRYKKTVSDYSNTEMQAQMLTYFRDDYDLFQYADGKYVAASLDKSSTLNATIYHVEIQFENGALVSLSFSTEDGSSTCDVFAVGETEITLPTEYTDLVPTA